MPPAYTDLVGETDGPLQSTVDTADALHKLVIQLGEDDNLDALVTTRWRRHGMHGLRVDRRRGRLRQHRWGRTLGFSTLHTAVACADNGFFQADCGWSAVQTATSLASAGASRGVRSWAGNQGRIMRPVGRG